MGLVSVISGKASFTICETCDLRQVASFHSPLLYQLSYGREQVTSF